jgi:hypothetical protein
VKSNIISISLLSNCDPIHAALVALSLHNRTRYQEIRDVTVVTRDKKKHIVRIYAEQRQRGVCTGTYRTPSLLASVRSHRETVMVCHSYTLCFRR